MAFENKKQTLFVDKFDKQLKEIGIKSKTFNEISKNMEILWKINPKKCVNFILKLRTIENTSKLFEDESMMNLLWLALNHKYSFFQNVHILTHINWKDIITMMSLDLQYHGYENRQLDWNFFRATLFAGLINSETTEKVKNILPKCNLNSNTLEDQSLVIIAKHLACYMFKNDSNKTKKYTEYITSNKIINFDNLIKIDFKTVHGKSLSLIVGKQFLQDNNLLNIFEKWYNKRTEFTKDKLSQIIIIPDKN